MTTRPNMGKIYFSGHLVTTEH